MICINTCPVSILIITGFPAGGTDGLAEGDSEELGDCDGLIDGDVDGEALGDSEGLVDEDTDGDSLGDIDGDVDGDCDGLTLALGD